MKKLMTATKEQLERAKAYHQKKFAAFIVVYVATIWFYCNY